MSVRRAAVLLALGAGTLATARPATAVPTPDEPVGTGTFAASVAEAVVVGDLAAPAPDFLCPVAGPVEFTDSWGAPRGGGRRHEGVDMMAAFGTPVVAPVSGVVVDRGHPAGGLGYHLEGDDGNYYYGAHLESYGASGRVEQGDVLGYVGATGNADGTPHLHFEIHLGGQFGEVVNPYGTVRTACQ